jgi:hypothetical protein
MSGDDLVRVRCPYCRKLAVKASPGSVLEVRCRGCNGLFGGKVVIRPPKQREDPPDGPNHPGSPDRG